MSRYQMGDMVFAATDLFNEPIEESGQSAIPGVLPGELLAAKGARGVIVNAGHVEAEPGLEIYLVRFESDEGGALNEPIGCLADELCQT